MTTVTRPMSLGQGKRLAAILVDSLPVNDITEMQAKALTGILGKRLSDFWKMTALSGLQPLYMHRTMPTVDMSFLDGIIDNVADFTQKEFYFPEGFTPKEVETVVLPVNYDSSIHNLKGDILSGGWRPATPEEALGMLKESGRYLKGNVCRKIVILSEGRFGGDSMIIEYSSIKKELLVLRDRSSQLERYRGEYSVLVVQEARRD